MTTEIKRRILFVDDEERVLDGLRRMLRPKRKVWDMAFMSNPGEAAASLSSEKYDVVVSDMRMPGMDGAELLKRVKDAQPDTVRIILSGQSDAEASARAVSVAHQFAAKPCQPDALQELIERVVSLNSLLASDELKAMVGGLKKLPTTPKVYHELEKVLANPEVSLDAVAHIIETDVALAAKVLQAVNSSFFGLRQRISNIAQAVSYLGSSAVRSIILSLGTLGPLERKAKRAGVSVESERVASLHVANIAKNIAQGKTQQEDAFTAGLLHRAGRLVLAVNLGKDYAKIVAQAKADELPVHAAEHAALGVTNAAVGAYLLGLWGLPHSVVEAVALQNRPADVPQRDFDVLAALHIAIGLTEGESHDQSYIQQLGMDTKLDEWRQMAANLNDQAGVA